MNFKKWVKSIQTAGYNGARKVIQDRLRNTTFSMISFSMALELDINYIH